MLNVLIIGGADVNLQHADSGLTALMLAASQVPLYSQSYYMSILLRSLGGDIIVVRVATFGRGFNFHP